MLQLPDKYRLSLIFTHLSMSFTEVTGDKKEEGVTQQTSSFYIFSDIISDFMGLDQVWGEILLK